MSVLINDLYYGHTCECCGGFENAARHGIKFSPEALAKGLERIYRGLNVRDEIEDNIFRETLRLFLEAAAKGMAETKDFDLSDDFAQQIRTNTAVFSAFRTHRMQNDLAAQLLDSEGRLKPFRQWVKDVQGMTNHYVRNWLNTEYNTAVIRAHAAADWQQYQKDSDIYPNLQWMPTTSPNQDPLHRQYWESKLTLPVNHPFWDEHRPGDRWNCKCRLRQTDDPANDTVIKDFYPVPQQPGLDNNPGKDGKLFNDTHPYVAKAYKGAAEAVMRKTIQSELQELVDNVKNVRTVNRMTDLIHLPKDVRTFLKSKGITPESKALSVSDRRIGHALRDTKKARGKAVSEQDLMQALSNLNQCEVYYDESHKNLWYVWNTGTQLQKYVFGFDGNVKVDGELYKVNEMLTAGIIEARDLKHKHLIKIR